MTSKTKKLEAAETFGATHTVNGTQPESAAERVKELTSGRGADYVFVTVGNSAAVSHGLSLVRKRRGTVVLVGIPEATATVPLSIPQHVMGEQRLIGSLMGSVRLSVDVPRLVQLYQNGRLKLDELITGRYSLEQINAAIESTESGDALRNVIVFASD